MKHSKHLAITILVAAAFPAFAQEPKKPVYRDAETHDLIVKKLRVNQEIDPVKHLTPSEGEDPSVKNQPKNLIDSSDIISFNGLTTLVPKRSVIRVPAIYEDRMDNHRPGHKVVGWLEFYRLNRGWITTVEVTRAQAEGREPLAEEVAENLSKSRNLLVATYSSGPISMLPPKEPVEEPTEEKVAAATPNPNEL
ncbi:MAG: hypothetical protein ACSHX9_08100 [Luteolibacter sp.]